MTWILKTHDPIYSCWWKAVHNTESDILYRIENSLPLQSEKIVFLVYIKNKSEYIAKMLD